MSEQAHFLLGFTIVTENFSCLSYWEVKKIPQLVYIRLGAKLNKPNECTFKMALTPLYNAEYWEMTDIFQCEKSKTTCCSPKSAIFLSKKTKRLHLANKKNYEFPNFLRKHFEISTFEIILEKKSIYNAQCSKRGTKKMIFISVYSNLT